ncbi:hypothetical protein IKJ53_07360 [bacterium]|nr:hypothetical protein [bacterium]
MSNIDEIIKSNNSNGKSFDRDSWVKKKQEERAMAYKLMDETADTISKDDSLFKMYLDIQGSFDKYSVGNCLLITSQMPNATQIKDFEGWKEAGTFIKKNAKSITILEPGDQYTRADGTVSTSYNPKKVFDISQTNMKSKPRNVSMADKTKLTAILNECPVDVKVVDDISGTTRLAEWNKDDNVLYVRKNEDIHSTFVQLAQELARAGLETTGNTELDNFKSSCVAYMVCKKHNVDVANYELKIIPDSMRNMTPSEIRNELSSMRSTMEDINSRISQHYEKMAKTPKNKDYER